MIDNPISKRTGSRLSPRLQKISDDIIASENGNSSSLSPRLQKISDELIASEVAPTNTPSKDNTPSLLDDFGNEVAQGGYRTGAGLASLVGADGVQSYFNDKADASNAALSDAQRTADTGGIFEKTSEGSDLNPLNYGISEHGGRALFGAASGSVIPTLAGLGAGGLLAKGASVVGNLGARGGLVAAAEKGSIEAAKKLGKRQLIEGVGGFAAGEGGVAAGSSKNQMQLKVAGMSDSEIESSPYYNEQIAKGMTPEQARQELSDAASNQAAWTVGAATALFGGAAGHVFTKMFGKYASIPSSRLNNVGKGFLAEGGQETTQGAAEQALTNLSTQDYIDPNQSIAEGVGGAALSSGLTGGVIGAGVGSFASIKSNKAQTKAGRNIEGLSQVEDALSTKYEAMSPVELRRAELGLKKGRNDGNAQAVDRAIELIASARNFKSDSQVIDEVKRSNAPVDEQVDTVADKLSNSIDDKLANINGDANEVNSSIDSSLLDPSITPPEAVNDFGAVESPVKNSIINDKAITQDEADKAALAKLDLKNAEKESAKIIADSKKKESQANKAEADKVARDKLAVDERKAKYELMQKEDEASAEKKAVEPHTVKTESGKEVKVKFKVMSSDDLIASHKADGSVNDKFPSDIQPRDRSRNDSQSQIASIGNNLDPERLNKDRMASNGAPIVGKDNVVESGNGRTLAIRYAYGNKKSDEYNKFVSQRAIELGMTPDEFANIKNPILVQERQTDMNKDERIAFTKDANTSAQAGMSSTEQAKSDAGFINSIAEKFKVSDNGEINTSANSEFVTEFMRNIPNNEHANLMQADSTLSQSGILRIRNALFMSAYREGDLVSKLAESTDSGIKNVLNGLTSAAGATSDIIGKSLRKQIYPLGIGRDIGNAAIKFASIQSNKSETVDSFISGNENALIDKIKMTKVEVELLKAFDRHKRSGKKIGEILNGYAKAVNNLGSPKQEGMFTDSANKPSKIELLRKVISNIEDSNQVELLPVKQNNNKGELLNEGTFGKNSLSNKIEVTSNDSSKNFKKWFGDSVVVDSNGNPKIVYHGTGAKVTDSFIFDYSRIGEQGRSEGAGFYFSENNNIADGYNNDGSTLDVYLSIKKPIAYNQKGFDGKTVSKILNKYIKLEANKYSQDISDGFLSNFGDVNYDGFESVLGSATESFSGMLALDQLGSIIGSGGDIELINRAVYDITKYDGIVADGFSDNGGDKLYVAFFPEQIKSTKAIKYKSNNPDIFHAEGVFSKENPVGKDALEEVAKIVGNVAAARSVDKLPNGSNGRYDIANKAIEILNSIDSSVEVAWHESFHALQKQIFNQAQLNILNKSFDKGKTLRRQIERTMKENGLGKITKSDNFTNEEAQAYAFQSYMLGGFKVNGTVKGLFAKLKELFEKVSNYMKGNGYESLSGIFSKAAEGKFAKTVVPVSMLKDLGGVNGKKAVIVPRKQKAADEDIAKNGFAKGESVKIAVDADGIATVIDSNHHLRAAIKAGIKELPITVEYQLGSDKGAFSKAALRSTYRNSDDVFNEIDAKRESFKEASIKRGIATYKLKSGWKRAIAPNDMVKKSKAGYSIDSKDLGIQTASFDKAEVLSKVLAKITALDGKLPNSAEVSEIALNIEENGYNFNEVVEIHVDQDGLARIKDGAKRIHAAIEAGISKIPTMIKYFNNGEKSYGFMSPDSLGIHSIGGNDMNVMFNEGTFSKAEMDDVTALQEAYDKIGVNDEYENMPWYNSWYRKTVESVQSKLWLRIKIANFDRFAAMYEYELERYLADPENEGKTRKDLPYHKSNVYMSMRLTMHADKAADFMLTQGQLEFVKDEDGILIPKRLEGKLGLIQILATVGNEEAITSFLNWKAGNLALRLINDGEGKENHFTKEQAKALIKQGEDNAAFGEFKKADKLYKEYDRNKLQFLVDSGAITQEAAEAMLKHGDHISFYRIAEDMIMDGNGKNVFSSGVHSRNGGKMNVKQLIENVTMNTTVIVDAAFKAKTFREMDELFKTGTKENSQGKEVNTYDESVWKVAHADVGKGLTTLGSVVNSFEDPKAQKINELAKQNGFDFSNLNSTDKKLIMEVSMVMMPSNDKIISFMMNGKRQYREVSDPLMLRAINGLNRRVVSRAMQIAALPKRLLTTAVTAEPSFALANLFRDPISSRTATDVSFSPADVLKGLKSSFNKDDDFLDALILGAMPTAGNLTDTSVSGIKAHVRSIKESALSGGAVGNWHRWMNLLGHTENATRMATFSAARRAKNKDGSKKHSDREAAFMALDNLDFSLHGDNKFTLFFHDVVPFFNARLQGLYKLGRSWQTARPNMLKVGGIIALTTLALAISNANDERYKALPEYEKDAYWIAYFGGTKVRMPKAFESGAFFGTMVERLFEYANNGMDGDLLWDRAKYAFSSTFNMDFTPQFVKPLYEIATDKDGFTDNPIFGAANKHGSDKYKYKHNTSSFAKELAKFTNLFVPDFDVLDSIRTPVGIEHAFKGYLGTLGRYSLDSFDWITDQIKDNPEKADSLRSSIPVLGRFFQEAETHRTKYVNAVYDMNNKAIDYQSDYKNILKEDGYAEASAFRKENANIFSARMPLQRAVGILKQMSKQRQSIQADKRLSGEQKRKRINALEVRVNIAAKRMYKYKEYF